MNNTQPCLKADLPGATGLAALATVGLHYGLPLNVPSLRRMTGLGSASIDGVMLIFAAGICGFDALPFEVEFAQLPLVALPAILAFHDDSFRVLYSVDAHRAVVGDTRTGMVETLLSAELETQWSGDVYQLHPNAKLPSARQDLRRLESPALRAAALLGSSPLSLSRLLFTGAVALWIGAIFYLPVLTLLTGACALISLWMFAFPRGCQKCGATKSLSGGLPLPALGAVFYALLSVATIFAPSAIFATGLFAATGAHLALVGILLRKRLACYACLATAVLAWSATALGLWTVFPAAPGLAWEAAALPATALATLVALHLAAKLARSQSAVAAFSLASRVTSEPPPGAGTARLIVYTREHCPLCVYAKGVILPSLEEEFGPCLTVETRDAAAMPIGVPLFFITGGGARLGLASVPTEEMLVRLAAAIQLALAPAQEPLASLPGVHLSGFDDIFSSPEK